MTVKAWQGLRWLAPLLVVVFTLTACGGGGNGPVRTAPASTPPPPTQPTAPQPPLDAQLSITNTYAAHAAGYTGKGVTIGMVDSGIMRSNPTVSGRVLQEYIDVDPSTNNTSIDDVVGHGTWVSEIAAGTPFAQFPGGIAPGADLVSARIIDDNAPDDNGSTPPATVTTQDAQFFQSVNQQLIGSGVKVMNNSWGGITWDTSNTSVNQAFDAAYGPFVNQQGGLVVFAAGNDSNPNPSTIAALPSVAPDLAKGWLVAVAVDSNDPTRLDSFSNKCGIAMDYCLAAPGDVVVLDKDTIATTTNPTYWDVSGTSFAAPQVSGAAALVWQAFPYFTNDLVRQTLLGTADPLGGSQPNATFGYGELDVGRAVNGPMQFNWGDVTVDFSGSSSWNNPISGAGGLIKQGPGTLNLTQPSSYTGLTQVQGGTLTAVSLASGATISAGATLSGMQSIGGNVTNAGVLGIANTNVTVNGNYVQQTGGRLAASLGSALDVSGTATLSGGDLFVTGTNSGYTVNSHTDVLTAKGGLTGTFSALDAASNVLLTASLGYDANDAWLNVQQVQVSAVQGASYTPASYGAAQRVDAAFGQINAQLTAGPSASTTAPVNGDSIAAAGNLQRTATVAQLQNSLESLSGQLHAASAAMLFDGIDAAGEALAQHFDEFLSGRTQPGTWYAGLGWQGDLQRSGYGGATFRSDGAIVGSDFRVGPDALLGYAVGESRGYGQLDASWDHNQTWADHAMLYGGMWRGPWYASARVGGGRFHEDMQRLLLLGGLAAPVGSGFAGSYLAGSLEGGYRLHAGATSITPFVDVRYQRLNQGAFAETGGYGFGLMADARTVGRLQTGVGLRAERGWWLANGMRMQFDGSAAWRHALHQYGDAFNASFTGFDDWIPIDGVGLSRSESVLRAGLSLWPTRDFALRLGYTREQGSRQQANSVMLQGAVSF